MRSSRRFAFRLARVLGYAHPDLLLDELSSSQFEEWKAYAMLEPLDDTRRLEYAIAQLCSIVTNIATSLYSKNKTKDYEPKDFLIDWAGDFEYNKPKKQSPEEMKAIFLALASAQKRKKPKKKKGDK